MEIRVQINPEVVNAVYRPYYANQCRYLLLYGGAGSGKSIFAAQKVLFRCLDEMPHRILVCRKTGRSIRQSQFRLFRELIAQYNLGEIIHRFDGDMRFEFANGNEIISSGLDDTEKLKSIHGITSIWIEEATELEESDFNQLNLRLRGETKHYKQIILSFNPIDEEHWIRRRFFPSAEDTAILKTTYQDNVFIDDEYKSVLDYYRGADPSYWQVYGEGHWGTPKLGNIFLPAGYAEYDELPSDVRSVIYCDPNLSLKAKGDTTAIVELGYSPSSDFYPVVDVACKSFDDSNHLLNAVLAVKRASPAGPAIGFDGNVSQESTWTNFVRAWCRQHELAFPPIEYKRYRVDDLVKNIQAAWTLKRIRFPQGFRDQPQNKRFLGQLFSFQGKKAGLPDDAPDALICAFEFLHERNLQRAFAPPAQPVIQNEYSF